MSETGQISSVLTPADARAVLALAAAAETTDGIAPLSEQTLLRLQDAAATVDLRHALVHAGDGRLMGYAQLDAVGAAELVVAPADRKKGIGRQLLSLLERATGDGPLLVWAHGEQSGAAALAAAGGYARSRVLLQLRRSLREPLADPQLPDGVVIRTFLPGVDESAWLAVNNAAFATHPEQGRWTLHDVEQREKQSWFDPAGLFLAERNGELIGFHWTKVHAEESPPIGEVYVVGVRPQDGGQGLGPALTLVGLHHLRALGLAEVLLYVDEDNRPAMKTYERLGFSRWSTDVLYERPSA